MTQNKPDTKDDGKREIEIELPKITIAEGQHKTFAFIILILLIFAQTGFIIGQYLNNKKMIDERNDCVIKYDQIMRERGILTSGLRPFNVSQESV